MISAIPMENNHGIRMRPKQKFPHGTPLRKVAKTKNSPSVELLLVCVSEGKAHPQELLGPHLPPERIDPPRVLLRVLPHPPLLFLYNNPHQSSITPRSYFQQRPSHPVTSPTSPREAHLLGLFYRATRRNPPVLHHQILLMSQQKLMEAHVQGHRHQSMEEVRSDLYPQHLCFLDRKQPANRPET